MKSGKFLFHVNAWIAGWLAELFVRVLYTIVVVSRSLGQIAARNLAARWNKKSIITERAAVFSQLEIDSVRCTIVGDPRGRMVFASPECRLRPVD